MDTTLDDLLYFIDEALNGMAAILTGLGDDLANRAPNLPGANTPFAIATHCLGVMNFWGGQVVGGREIVRDREAEFRAHGRVEDLVRELRSARERLRRDVTGIALNDPVAKPPRKESEHYAHNSGPLIHILEELAQHHGHMEITRDILDHEFGS